VQDCRGEEDLKIRLVGIFKKAYGNGQALLHVKEKKRLRDVVQEIAASSSKLKHVLIDPELGSPLPTAVILVNGKEIGVLNGLETEVDNGDEIVLIPVIHGG